MAQVDTPFTFGNTLSSLSSAIRWNYRHHSFRRTRILSQSGLPDCRCVECKPRYRNDYERLGSSDSHVSDIRSTLYDSGTTTPSSSSDDEGHDRQNHSQTPSQYFTLSRTSVNIPVTPIVHHSTLISDQQIENRNRDFSSPLPMEGALPPALDRKRKRAQAFTLEEDVPIVLPNEVDSYSEGQGLVVTQPDTTGVRGLESPKSERARVVARKTPPCRQQIQVERNSITTSEGPSRLLIVDASTRTPNVKASAKVSAPKKKKINHNTCERKAKESHKKQVKEDQATRKREEGKKNIMDENVRRKAMEDDPYSSEVGPHHVWCVFCNKPTTTDRRSRYYNNLWEKHKRASNHKRAVKEAQGSWNVDELPISVQQALLDLELKAEEERLMKEKEESDSERGE